MIEVFGGKYTRTGLVLMVLEMGEIPYRLHELDMRDVPFARLNF